LAGSILALSANPNSTPSKEKGADPGLDRTDRPPAADCQQRGAGSRRDHRHHVDNDHDVSDLGARVVSLNKSRMMAKVIAVLAAPIP
jgi:hypothetical protein